MRLSFATQIVLALCVGISLECRASRPNEDHLVPVKEAVGSSAIYQELWQRELLLTPGEIARFVGLPGTIGVETAVSVYQASGKENSLPGNYWVTATQASDRIWNSVEGSLDPKTIRVERCDAPIEESIALAIHKLWLAMLSQSRPQQHSNEIVVDSSREIFSAANSRGIVLEGESSTTLKRNTKGLIKIALSLMEYCDGPASKRAELTREIEKTTLNLLARVASSSGSKKHNPKSTSSSKAAISPRKQNISQPIADGRSARPPGVTRLGSSIGDFVSIWGPPSRKETLARTANLKWKRRGLNGASVVPGAFAVEVAFLDGIAREIALRSTERITPHKLVKLAKPFLTTFRSADFVKPEAEADAFPAYKLSDGTFVWANKRKRHTVIVIKSPGYSRNEERSNREAAKIRPLTSNH
jgi:hypothetical protein